MPHELTVDPTACEGYGVCFDLAPDLLAPDDWGYPIVLHREVPKELLRDARRAAAACPRLALHLHRERRREVSFPERRLAPTGLPAGH